MPNTSLQSFSTALHSISPSKSKTTSDRPSTSPEDDSAASSSPKRTHAKGVVPESQLMTSSGPAPKKSSKLWSIFRLSFQHNEKGVDRDVPSGDKEGDEGSAQSKPSAKKSIGRGPSLPSENWLL